MLPIYAFGSGGIQPAHMMLALFFTVVLFRRGIAPAGWVCVFAALMFYVFFLEAFYVLKGGEPESLLNGVFFAYNFFLVCAIYSYCKNYGLRGVAPGVLASCAIAIAALAVGGISFQESGQGRATGTFNNPNQLGYFSVCILSIAYLLYRHGHLKYLVAVMVFAVSAFLSIASLSKAAMIANFVVIFLALKPAKNVGASRTKLAEIGVSLSWILIALCLFGFFFVAYWQGALDEYLFIKRLQGMSQEQDSSLESRGYFSFLEGHPIQIIFGLGSEAVADIAGHEVHSTLASIFNNYGVIGFFLFIGLLAGWALNLWRAYGFLGLCCLAGPAMLYGITHNGTRFTAFWLLFGATMAMANLIIQQRKTKLSGENKTS